MSLNDLAAWASVLALLAAIIPLAFSARKYLSTRNAELKKERFETYHRILRTASSGHDEHGQLKLVSQLAYVYELRNFPEYAELTKKLLIQLKDDWARNGDSEKNVKLSEAVDETVAHLGRGHN